MASTFVGRSDARNAITSASFNSARALQQPLHLGEPSGNDAGRPKIPRNTLRWSPTRSAQPRLRASGPSMPKGGCSTDLCRSLPASARSTPTRRAFDGIVDASSRSAQNIAVHSLLASLRPGARRSRWLVSQYRSRECDRRSAVLADDQLLGRVPDSGAVWWLRRDSGAVPLPPCARRRRGVAQGGGATRPADSGRRCGVP
jgi:hypothetical protein